MIYTRIVWWTLEGVATVKESDLVLERMIYYAIVYVQMYIPKFLYISRRSFNPFYFKYFVLWLSIYIACTLPKPWDLAKLNLGHKQKTVHESFMYNYLKQPLFGCSLIHGISSSVNLTPCLWKTNMKQPHDVWRNASCDEVGCIKIHWLILTSKYPKMFLFPGNL